MGAYDRIATALERIAEELAALNRTASNAGKSLLSREAAAKRLGVRVSRVGEMIADGILTTTQVGSRSRIPAAEVERIAAAGLPPPRVRARPQRRGAASDLEADLERIRKIKIA